MLCHTDYSEETLQALHTRLNPDKTVAIIDSNLRDGQRALLEPIFRVVPENRRLYLTGGEEVKSLGLVKEIALWLNRCRVTRHSLIYVVGGGSLLDFCGFVAAIYKRGVPIAYVPTTLMAMVDAAYGGKTAINTDDIKNLLGVFQEPNAILLDERFLTTLSDREILSGYAEVLKYALLEDDQFFAKVLTTDPLNNGLGLRELIDQCVTIKKRFVEADPYDLGIRQYLNLGHTVGHALEGFSHTLEPLGHPALRHGEAVMIGIIVELYISHKMLGFPLERMHQIVDFVKEFFSPYFFGCKQYNDIINLMLQDKKNSGDDIAIIALRRIGEPMKINASRVQLRNAFDFYREVIGG